MIIPNRNEHPLEARFLTKRASTNFPLRDSVFFMTFSKTEGAIFYIKNGDNFFKKCLRLAFDFVFIIGFS